MKIISERGMIDLLDPVRENGSNGGY